MSRSFAEGGLTYHSNRKDARAASLNSLPLSTSAPSRVRALSFSSTPVKLGETDESFGRKVPKHVANQERLFSLIETRKCEPSSPIRYPATVSTSPLRLPSVCILFGFLRFPTVGLTTIHRCNSRNHSSHNNHNSNNNPYSRTQQGNPQPLQPLRQKLARQCLQSLCFRLS